MPRPRKLSYTEGSVYMEKADPRRTKATKSDRRSQSGAPRWRGELWVNGRRRRVSGLSRAEVVGKLDDLRSNADKELEQGPSGQTDMTLGQWVERYSELVVAAKEDPNTQSFYDWAFRQTEPLWSISLRALTQEDVEDLLGSLAAREPAPMESIGKHRGKARGTVDGHLGPTSLRRVRMALAAALDEAMSRGHVEKNVARPALLPAKVKSSRRARQSLTAKQAERLRRVAADDPNGLVVLLPLMLGLRPGEVLGLPWGALDLDKGLLTVQQTLVRRPGGGVAFGTPKKDSYRTLKMPDGLRLMLRKHRTTQKRQRVKARAWEDNDLVFPTTIGTPMDHSAMRKLVQSAGAKVGVPELSPNELRHTTASLLIDGGAHPTMVSDLLGHRDGRMVNQTYRHKIQPVVDLSEAQERMLKGR
jgi:integrase